MQSVGRSFFVALAFYTSLSIGFAFVPLFNLLGYEFSAALSLVASILAGPVAIGVLRRDTNLSQKPHKAVLRSVLLNQFLLVLPLVIMLLNAVRVTNCNVVTGLVFYLLLPCATALIASLWGSACGFISTARFVAGGLYCVLWLGVAFWNIYEVWVGLQVDSYNQILGWVSGPIYEDVVEPGSALLLSRFQGLFFALALVCAAFFIRNSRQLVKNKRLAVGVGTLGLFALVSAVCFWLYADEMGYGRSSQQIDRVLGAKTYTEHFVIQHPAGLDEETISLLARDHEFRLYQIETMLSKQDLPQIHSYVFESPAQKRRYTGAGRTQFAQPWQTSLCLNSTRFPHPTLKHELVHVYASAFGSWPFMVSARMGVLVNPGLTEGLAVSVDWPAEKFDRHTWCGALRRIGRAPNIQDMFGPLGFWTAASARSYTLAGSFVRYLLTQYGAQAVLAAYRDGQLTGHFPKDTQSLVKDWNEFLDGLHIDEGTLQVARLRFSKGSVFSQKCAHEIAALRSLAQRQLHNRNYIEAHRYAEEILSHLGQDRGTEKFLVELQFRQGNTQQALTLAEKLLEHGSLGHAEKARFQGQIGNLLVIKHQPEQAKSYYLQLLKAHLDDASDRTALVKLQALEHEQGHAVLDYLTKDTNGLGLLGLHEAVVKEPDWAVPAYLIGRQLVQRRRYAKALLYLGKAAQIGLDHPALRAENLYQLALAHYLLANQLRIDTKNADPKQVQQHLTQAGLIIEILARFPRHPGEAVRLADWAERLHFERTHTIKYRTSTIPH